MERLIERGEFGNAEVIGVDSRSYNDARCTKTNYTKKQRSCVALALRLFRIFCFYILFLCLQFCAAFWTLSRV